MFGLRSTCQGCKNRFTELKKPFYHLAATMSPRTTGSTTHLICAAAAAWHGRKVCCFIPGCSGTSLMDLGCGKLLQPMDVLSLTPWLTHSKCCHRRKDGSCQDGRALLVIPFGFCVNRRMYTSIGNHCKITQDCFHQHVGTAIKS